MRDDSPFTPRNPVPDDLFVGREDIMKDSFQYIRQAASGRQEHIFLVGERGIGKTSLALYLGSAVQIEVGLLPVHVNLAGVTTLEELVRKVFEGILNAANRRDWLAKIRDMFGGYIDKIGMFGVSLSFKPPTEKLTDLVSHFPEALSNIAEKIKGQMKGLFIVLDDINGLCVTDKFAHWYKGLVEDIAAHHANLAIAVMSVGLPEIRAALVEHQPSLMRVFSIERLTQLPDENVEGFFNDAFKKANMGVESKAMNRMVRFSGGLPVFMQEIGDSVFSVVGENTVVNESHAIDGIRRAAGIIGGKYLTPKVYEAIRSRKYISTLRRLGEMATFNFSKKDLKRKLNDDEGKVLDNFLKKMRELEVILQDKESGPGWYRFSNRLYWVYVALESQGSLSKLSHRESR